MLTCSCKPGEGGARLHQGTTRKSATRCLTVLRAIGNSSTPLIRTVPVEGLRGSTAVVFGGGAELKEEHLKELQEQDALHISSHLFTS